MKELNQQLDIEKEVAQISLNEIANRTSEYFTKKEEKNNQPGDLEQ